MADHTRLASNQTPTAYSDWPTLIERAVDDVSRILRSEAQMFQTSMGGGSRGANIRNHSVPGDTRCADQWRDMHYVLRHPSAPSMAPLVAGLWNCRPGYIACRHRE